MRKLYWLWRVRVRQADMVELGRRIGLKIQGEQSRASSSLAIRTAELKGLRCNKTLFVWIQGL